MDSPVTVTGMNPSLLHSHTDIPSEYIWPKGEVGNHSNDLNEPLIDLKGFLKGDEVATKNAVELVRTACSTHGFFQIANHGVDSNLLRTACEASQNVFELPLEKKLAAQRKPGKVAGYSGAHADRFSSKLPWKETFSFCYNASEDSNSDQAVRYFASTLGPDFEPVGLIFQEYCEEMNKLSLAIFELLGLSLGIDRHYYRKYFEDGSSIMRCNYYPPCNKYNLTLGTGPHSDPNALTILHQDEVGGLQVFVNERWQAVRPRQDCLVVNIGDTFMALSNGLYKSCLHRAVVNRNRGRRSLVFFACPREDKMVVPPRDFVIRQGTRKYPDFKWSHLLEFTQSHYRADVETLRSFIPWLLSAKHY